jgi:MOSC domain-containing protein YiiM
MSGTVKGGQVIGVCLSHHRQAPKKNIGQGLLRENWGLEGDSHAGTERQISLLSSEDVKAACKKRKMRALPGAFAENIATRGIDLGKVNVGTQIRLGEAKVEVVGLGKNPSEPHTYGYCGLSLLPEKGVFARVVKGGLVRVGDVVEVDPLPDKAWMSREPGIKTP